MIIFKQILSLGVGITFQSHSTYERVNGRGVDIGHNWIKTWKNEFNIKN